MEQSYDVIIIGGGIGGLTAGNYLARQGVKTIIYEGQDHAGGYVTSFQRSGFQFDAGVTSFGSNGIVFPILQELGLGDLVFHRVKRQLVTRDWAARIDGSFQSIRDQLKVQFPEERGEIEQYFAWLEMTVAGFRSLFATKLFLEEWRDALWELTKVSLKEWRFIKFLWQNQRLTNRQLHHDYFQNMELIDLFNHLGYPVMSGVVTAGMWYSFKEDYWYPEGGMGKFRDHLVNAYLASGGEIRYQTPVTKILLAKQPKSAIDPYSLQSDILSDLSLDPQQVYGLRLATGQEVRAKQIISNVNPQTTYLQLVGVEETLEHSFLTQLQCGETSGSISSLYLGLAGKGFGKSPYPLETASHHTFYLTDESSHPVDFALYILTHEDPKLAPNGEVVILHCYDDFAEWEPYLPRTKELHLQKSGFALDYHTTAYQRKKNQRLEEMMGLARRVIPDLDQRLQVQELATPLTLYRYTGNPKGATAGWSWNPARQPRLTWSQQGKIPGLNLVGAWILQPGGIPTAMLTGRWVAKKIAKEFLENSHESEGSCR